MPLRASGAWRRYVHCHRDWIVPVPDEIEDDLAARAFINPLSALLMLSRWPSAGERLLLSAANSSCAMLLAAWAIAQGAREVTGIVRSSACVRQLMNMGVNVVHVDRPAQVTAAARAANLVFDAVGGPVAETILDAMQPGARFVSYGLLSQVFPRSSVGRAELFQLRAALGALTPACLAGLYHRIWRDLPAAPRPPTGALAN